jgi:signal transduction histidine kinase
MEQKIKILFLDEDELSFLKTQDLLNCNGKFEFELDYKSFKLNGLNTILQHNYDICLLDCCYGIKNGLLDEGFFKNRLNDVPVILLTEYEELQKYFKEIEAFDLDFLVKSELNPWLLSRAIKCNMSRQNFRNELSRKDIELQNLVQNLDAIVIQKTKSLETSRENLKKSLDKEIKLSEMKSKFVSMASHEFRTPLSSILSSASLIEKYPENHQQEKRKRHISRIKSSVQNLSFILNDFLSLDKMESGNIRYEPSSVDFEDFISQILDELSSLLHKNQFVKFQHKGENLIFVDPNLLKNVLINLLSNAIKYSPDGQDVILDSNNHDSLLSIQIKDNGIGIPDTDKKHMFECFFRASNAYHIQGTGLGLTIVKRYLDIMNGKINFQSELGKGTTFNIIVPISKNEPCPSSLT